MPKSWRTLKLCTKLKTYLNEFERAGFILTNGKIIELKNISETPAEDFLADDQEVLEHCDKPIVALWHTHPSGSANLSAEDWESFLSWPDVEQIIVAQDEIRFYAVKGRGVVNRPLPEK